MVQQVTKEGGSYINKHSNAEQALPILQARKYEHIGFNTYMRVYLLSFLLT